MADTNEDHSATVARQSHVSDSSERPQPTRTRVHRSIYLEQGIYDRLGEAYKTTNHELYPLEVRKSTFIEVCIAYALDHLPDIEDILRKLPSS